MSERLRLEYTERVGVEAIAARLHQLVRRIEGLAAELEANERERAELIAAHNLAVSEHNHLVAKLTALQVRVDA